MSWDRTGCGTCGPCGSGEAASDVFGHPVTVSSLLEQQATKAQKAAKIDIVDLIFE